MDWERAIEAGLYDPAAPNADDRRALISFLAEQGCDLDEMAEAHAAGRLFGLAGDKVVRPGRNEFTLREAAARVGADVELVQRLWRAYGLPLADADTKVASRADVATLPLFVAIAAQLGEETALGLARVAGASVARFADAISAAIRGALPDLSVETSASELTTARAYLGIAAFAPEAGKTLDALLRHHLDAARRQFELSDSYDVAGSGQVRLAVGFADLSGFTALTQSSTSDGLARLLDRFEDVAFAAVHERSARVVKFIGDAVMYVAPHAPTAVDIARAVVSELGAETPARAGVSYGVLLATDGDYFGPPVNLAARLVAVAEPGQVLVSAALRERLDETYATTALPPRELRGIAEPVTPYVVG